MEKVQRKYQIETLVHAPLHIQRINQPSNLNKLNQVWKRVVSH